MPIYEVDVGKMLVLAKDETDAKLGACNYVGGDLGIECLSAKIVTTNKELIKSAKEGFYDPSDEYDWVEDIELQEKLQELFLDAQDEDKK